MKKLNPIVRFALIALLSLVAGLQIYTWNAQSLTGNQIPMPFGIGASVVLSGSMEPELSVGDFLLLAEKPAYQVGDIVVYQSGNIAVVHRLVALDGQTAITKGDANNANDQPIPLDSIKGRVIAAIPLVGYGIWMLKNPAAILLTLGAAVLLVELSYHSSKEASEAEKEKIKAEIRQLMKELDQQ